jgi:DNA-binding NtrC family response regulator
MASPNIMVVSHNLEIQQAFAHVLGKCGLAPIIASTATEAEAILSWNPISLVISSDELPDGGTDGLIQRTRRAPKRVPVVVVSHCSDWEHCLGFLRRGALDFVLYPLNEFEIERVVDNALSLTELKKPSQASA